MSRACKHRNRWCFHRWLTPLWGTGAGRISWIACLDCRAWLPLGHSDETDPRVAVEIQAAWLASYDDPPCDGCESCGWHNREIGSFGSPHMRCHRDDFHAGYLAREILEHVGDEP